MSISRRQMLIAAAGAACAAPFAGVQNTLGQTAATGPATRPAMPVNPHPIPSAPAVIAAPPGFGVAQGPFQPTWESLSHYQVPDWYRDAKLGIWAHWGPQCQPERGDWYAQRMYRQMDKPDKVNPLYAAHCKRYGHPSKAGFKEVINDWKADQWDPDALVARYKKAGAKYFAAMANHHDNFDLWDSTYQPWNSTAVGPKKNLIGGWEKAARANDLRFALTCHGDRAWSWYQNAQTADSTGPLAGVPYDGILSKAEGKGTWWEGLDPQDLYGQYHEFGKYNWPQTGQPPIDPAFAEKFFNRTIDLITKYNPDLLYFDDEVLPIYPATNVGLRIAAYLYNTNLARNGGKLEAVMTGKGLTSDQRKALLLDVERGVTDGREVLPWQTDTCIGHWHYDRSVYTNRTYKKPAQVVQMLVDIVSKNGNLMLNIPVRGNGSIDDEEIKVIDALGEWMASNGDGIYGTRPFHLYGEGPVTSTTQPRGLHGGSRDVRAYGPEDIRYTAKGDVVYAFLMDWPANGKTVLRGLAQGGEHYAKKVGKVEVLSTSTPLTFTHNATGLVVDLPATKPGDFVYGLKITPA